jgi:hypothetical protein
MIVFVHLKMLRQLFDPLGEQGNLYLGGTRVIIVSTELLNNTVFLFLCDQNRTSIFVKLHFPRKTPEIRFS